MNIAVLSHIYSISFVFLCQVYFAFIFIKIEAINLKINLKSVSRIFKRGGGYGQKICQWLSKFDFFRRFLVGKNGSWPKGGGGYNPFNPPTPLINLEKDSW